MQHDPHHSPPPSPALPDRAHWTPARQRIFLAALLESRSVTHAARTAGMSRSRAQRLRRRLAGPPFDQQWALALRTHAARLADPFGAPPGPRRPTAARLTPARRPADAHPPPWRRGAGA